MRKSPTSSGTLTLGVGNVQLASGLGGCNSSSAIAAFASIFVNFTVPSVVDQEERTRLPPGSEENCRPSKIVGDVPSGSITAGSRLPVCGSIQSSRSSAFGGCTRTPVAATPAIVFVPRAVAASSENASFMRML